MEYGIFGSAVGDGTLDDVVAQAASTERDGFAAYWAPNIFGHDAMTALAVAGIQVPRIELGTAVVPTFPRHPHAIAQQALTVAAASGNRFTLGIGLSHKIVIENMLGLSYDKPVRHLREYLSVLMPLSRNEPANFDGEMYQVHAALSAKGAEGFSVVVAALGEQMLRVTAAMADGTLTWCTGPVTLANHIVPTITKAAEEFGRPAPRVIAALPVCVTDDRAGASARAAETFAGCPATGRCSIARVWPGRPISPSSAPPRRSRTGSARWPESASPTSPRWSSVRLQMKSPIPARRSKASWVGSN